MASTSITSCTGGSKTQISPELVDGATQTESSISGTSGTNNASYKARFAGIEHDNNATQTESSTSVSNNGTLDTNSAGYKARFTGIEHDNSEIFKDVVFPKHLATDPFPTMLLKWDLHQQQLMAIQRRYEARILKDHCLLIDGVWYGMKVDITEERMERVREYSAEGADIVAAWLDPETFFKNKNLKRPSRPAIK